MANVPIIGAPLSRAGIKRRTLGASVVASESMGEDTRDGILQPLRVRHAMMVFAAPRALFARVEDTGAYGWALVTLIGLVMLVGYAQVQTGLIDRDVDRATERRLAQLEESQAELLDRIELRTRMESIRKEGVFLKVMTRLGVVVASPVYLLASFLLIASALYAVVALTGRKPEYHTLMSICVYAGFIELTAYVLKLAMMLYYHSTEVDTSLRALAEAGKPSALGAIDPFRIWFWVLVCIGLVTTHQLSRRMAVVTCCVLGLGALGVRIALEYAAA